MIKTDIGFWGDRYDILDPIGRGGMATIYRGHDLLTDRVVAIKVLREVYTTDPLVVTYFQREAKIALSLRHPNKDVTPTSMALGMVQYCAPEQARDEIASPAADVYALGAVMYEMLTGHAPFDGDTPTEVTRQHTQDTPPPPSQFNPNIPRALEEIILRCLEKEPERRYRDGNTLVRALEGLGNL